MTTRNAGGAKASVAKSGKRTVRLGLMSYVDPAGAYRTANEGDTVEVHPDHIARFDRLNVVQTSAEPIGQDIVIDLGDDDPEQADNPVGEQGVGADSDANKDG
ncbi:hypothetical protein [Nocardia sp. SC052]|uniref:hypothetical protein n=1 Tax=Nocardia sichangensis TaxID=3385975 RepID=UPI0039A30D83